MAISVFEKSDKLTSTCAIGSYQCLLAVNQFAQSGLNLPDAVYHITPSMAYLAAALMYTCAPGSAGEVYWFIPMLFGAFGETVPIQQKYMMVYYTGCVQ